MIDSKQTFVAFVMLAVVLGAPAWAENKADDAEKTGGLQEYVEVKDSSLPTSNTIATKLTLPLDLTPASVGTVGSALLYEQDALNLSDALKNVSGLNIQNGSGTFDYFVIRGFDSISSGLVMTDGVPEPEASYYPMYNAKGVEVYKGPAGFLYGKNPLAGAVNIVRKQPMEGNFTILNGSFGSFDTQEGSLDWNQSSGDVSFRLNGLWQSSDHYRDGKDSRHLAINPSLTWRAGPNSMLNVNFEHVDAEYTPDAGLPLLDNALPNVSRKSSYDNPADFSEQELNRFQVDFETRISDTLTFRNKGYYRDLDWLSDGTLLLGENPFAVGPAEVGRSDVELDDRQKFYGNQAEFVIHIDGGSVQHELLAGLEVAYQDDEYSFEIGPESFLTFDTMEPVPGLPFPSLSAVGDVRTRIVAPYLIDQIRFSDRYQLILGVRYDFIDVDADVRSLFGGPKSITRTDSELSPMAGLVFAPDSSLSFYANAARSHAPPSSRVAELEAPETLKPETGTQFEVGVKKRFLDGDVRTTLAVYQLDREDIAIADMNFGFTQQTGDQRSRGVEIEVAAELGQGFRTFFSYAYNDAELTRFTPFVRDPFTGIGMVVDFSGNTPIMAPEHMANLWVTKSFANGFGAAAGSRFVDEQFVFEDNVFALDSSLVFDAAIFYEMDALRFKINLKNVTDEEYEMRGIAGASSVIPADPFAVYASVEFRM